MPSVEQIVHSMTGWLAIPASLFLLVSGCQTDKPTVLQGVGPATHSHSEAMDEGSPFQRIFHGDADFVILTFFDLYCVACQQSADNFRTLNARVQNEFPGKAIQVTGIGVGDTAFELSVFERKYNLGYTCLPDPDKSFEGPFALRGTPTILVFQRKGPDCLEVYRHEGRFRMDDLIAIVTEIRQRI